MNLALINIKQLVTVSSGGRRVKTGAAMRELGVIARGYLAHEAGLITAIGAGDPPKDLDGERRSAHGLRGSRQSNADRNRPYRT